MKTINTHIATLSLSLCLCSSLSSMLKLGVADCVMSNSLNLINI
jgi:hypothetical protein